MITDTSFGEFQVWTMKLDTERILLSESNSWNRTPVCVGRHIYLKYMFLKLL